jgi:hypothetical protein
MSNPNSIQQRIAALGLQQFDPQKANGPSKQLPTPPSVAPRITTVKQPKRETSSPLNVEKYIANVTNEIEKQVQENSAQQAQPVYIEESARKKPLPPPPRGTTRLSLSTVKQEEGSPAPSPSDNKPAVHYRKSSDLPAIPSPRVVKRPLPEVPQPSSDEGSPEPTRKTSGSVVVRKHPGSKPPPPPVPTVRKPPTLSVRYSTVPQNIQETLAEQAPAVQWVQYKPPEQTATENKKTDEAKKEKEISNSDLILKEQFTKKYEEATPEQVKATTVFQKYVRARRARRMYDKLKKNAQHRENCAKEMLSTEENYVKGLKTLAEVYMVPLKKLAQERSDLVTPAQVSALFADLETITNFNAHFLDRLKERMASFDKSTTKLSDIYLELAPWFKVYTRYCNNHDKASEIARQLKQNEEFALILKGMDKDERTSKLGLNSYMILPIQRIPRYRLLLEDYIKHTDPQHPDYAGLKKAHTSICEVADHLNAAMKTVEATQAILNIQDQFLNDVVRTSTFVTLFIFH